MPIYKGAEIIVEYLVREKVPYLFGLCGHGIIGLLDSVYDRGDRIKVVSVHHEAVAGFMADAYFRIAHRPVATFTSCGPGSAHLPVALASAFMDSSAFLAITGNVPTSQFNRGPFQETGRHFQADFPSVVKPYVKRSFQPTRVDMVALAMRQAFSTMLTGRPGPVHLDVPFNVFLEKAEADIPEPAEWRQGITSRSGGDPEAVTRAAEMLLAAGRPVILAGNGVHLAEADIELRELAELMQMPVATSPQGKGALDERHPLSLGPTGRTGTYPANQSTRTADVILGLGTGFDDRASSAWLPGYTFGIPPTRLIHVEIDPQELGRNYPPTVGILGDVRTVLRQLLEVLRPRVADSPPCREAYLSEVARWKAEWEAHVSPARTSDDEPIRPERLIADLRAVLPEESIVLADVGTHHNWMLQQWPTYRPRSLPQSFGFASMGFGVAGVLGAKLAAPARPVVGVVGDGGFLMYNNVVATAVEYDLPVVWVVWNNLGFVSIRDMQFGFFGKDRELVTRFRRDATGEFLTPDYAAIAKSMGAEGVVVTRPGDLKEQFAAALGCGRPCVLDVRVSADVPLPSTGGWDLPPLPTPRPGFGWNEDFSDR